MQITIQRDGRIMLEEHNEPERFLDPADPYALMAVLRSHTVFEEGLTLRQLMKAIRPWRQSFGAAGWMDFDAWLSEIDRTHLTTVTTDDPDIDPLSHLEIYNVIDIHRPDAGHLELSSHWDFHAYYETPVESCGTIAETCSVSFMPARAYANLPIRIDYKATVHDIQAHYLDGRRPVLRTSAPGLYDHIETDAAFFDVVVLGLLDKISFHGSPTDTAERSEGLAEALEAVRARVETDISASEESEACADDAPSDVTEDDIFEFLGLGDQNARFEAAIELRDALKCVGRLDAALAGKLDITLVGLMELKGDITAHLTINAMRRTTEIIRQHIAEANNA